MPAPPIEELIALAVRLVNAGQHDRARIVCDQAAAGCPPHAAVLQLLALLDLHAGHAAAARAHAAASLALRPGHVPTLLLAAEAASVQHDPAAAVEALQRVIELDPQRVAAQVNLGIALQDCGRIDDAMRAYARAFRSRPETFGRIAHALSTPATGRLWLDLDRLRARLAGDID